eukprot:m.121391 g.121391  ORF g.121391 m.121391 type:complete len:533 (-) comp19621_c0_seq3:129-1727(-)
MNWLLLLCAALWAACAGAKPNLLFLIDESTDAKAYFIGKEDEAPMELPNLRRIQRNGVSFMQNYVQAPVCCPSRASVWSGRQNHKIPHTQHNKYGDLFVAGAWNNYEGLDKNYTQKWNDLAEKQGYQVKIVGKTDYQAGGHSESCRVTAWTNRVAFPYTLKNGSRGWYDEDGPLIVTKHGNETNPGDWAAARSLAQWIKTAATTGQPFAGYAGFNIVHPPYVSSDFWLDRINTSRITIPQWIPLDQMHPEDFQATMKKGMAGDEFSADSYKVAVRKYYYAMIAEYDAMVGVLLDALEEAGVANNTYVIATSDHGDMNMEHRQYYKMTYYDPSSRVPLIISGPGVRANTKVNNITSLFDLFPTIADIVGATPPADIDAHSLMPFLQAGPTAQNDQYPDWALSQFHGDEIHLSWFMLRRKQYKYVVFGTGKEVPPRLFDMEKDPLESHDLVASMPDVVQEYDTFLRSIVDYPAVAEDVRKYNHASFRMWKNSMAPAVYNTTVAKGIRWSKSWAQFPEESYVALEQWLGNDTVRV